MDKDMLITIDVDVTNISISCEGKDPLTCYDIKILQCKAAMYINALYQLTCYRTPSRN